MIEKNELAREAVLTRLRQRHERLKLLTRSPDGMPRDPRRGPDERQIAANVVPPAQHSFDRRSLSADKQ
jgi:hypothetical protein